MHPCLDFLLPIIYTVFHSECYGITPAQLKKLPMVPCSQHNCVECNRNTAQSGGMLFRYVSGKGTLVISALFGARPPNRCQTCPQAFCEDCLPQGDIDAVGDVLPELYV